MPTKLLLLACIACQAARADFLPIVLTSDSYNQDVIVEKTAPGPVIAVTTASVEGGTNNIGFGWYERGYNADSQATGLPAAGATIVSEAAIDHEYQFAADYRANNALLIDSDNPAATLTLSAPAAYTSLSVLTSSGNGSGQLAYAVHHQDGSTEGGTFDSPNWLGPVGQAWTAYGRVDVRTFVFAGVHDANPRLYTRDLALTNTTSPVTAIDFVHLGGANHAVIFAVSGSLGPGEGFMAAPVTGFNQDMVVEASATRPGRMGIATTATIESGSSNLGYTWFERGYIPNAPLCGLPGPGSGITNALALDHRYVMAPSYSANNAVLIDASSPEAALTPASPAAFCGLSVLCAASRGPVTNMCRVQHADGIVEEWLFVAPDWMTTGAGAFNTKGRVNIDTRFPNFPGGGGPYLFGIDLVLTNTLSPITNLVMAFSGGPSADSHTVILAVSGQNGSAPAPKLTIVAEGSGRLRLTSTAPGTLQSTTRLQGSATVWWDEGTISSAVTFTPGADEPAKFFRVATPPGGSAR